ncbi:MAG: hypothetical protein ACT4PO_04300 [Actinomycetota bacterium]
MRGALITVSCDCGEIQYVPYGEAWECPTCGRRWNTAQIPADQYWGIMREMRRMRVNVIVAALVVAGVFVPLGIFVGERFFVLALLVLAGWYLFYMPVWRRKVRARARGLPTWKLKPE